MHFTVLEGVYLQNEYCVCSVLHAVCYVCVLMLLVNVVGEAVSCGGMYRL